MVNNIYLNQGKFNYYEKKIINEYKKVYQVSEMEKIKVGDITLVELNKEWEDENDSSSVFLMAYKNLKVLLTGDASVSSEKYILDNYDLDDIDILKAGHHGSKTSTSIELLKTINPKLVLISCGKNNKFKHPSKETIDKLEELDIPYLRTDEVGTITVDLDNGRIITEG